MPWGRASSTLTGAMADECQGVRAQATALEREIRTLRGVVAVLRQTRAARVVTHTRQRDATFSWRCTLLAFVLGVAVTLAGTAIFLAAIG